MNFFKYVCLFALLLLLKPSIAQDEAKQEMPLDADMVWHESQSDLRTIVISLYRDGQWGQPQKIYQTKSFVSSAVSSTLQDGRKIVFWSEDQKEKTKLYFTVQQSLGDMSRWSEPLLLPFKCRECLAATAVLDFYGNLWLFWTDNASGHDDVFYSIYTNGQWASVEQVNAKNQVPDILPISNLNDQGQVEVQWQSYSVLSTVYQTSSKTFGEPLSNDIIAPLVNELVLQPSANPFALFNTANFVHLPSKRIQQNISLRN